MFIAVEGHRSNEGVFLDQFLVFRMTSRRSQPQLFSDGHKFALVEGHLAHAGISYSLLKRMGRRFTRLLSAARRVASSSAALDTLFIFLTPSARRKY